MRFTPDTSCGKGRKALAVPAFTLIELLVVIGILTLLMSILLPLLGKARTASYMASTRGRVGYISTAIEQYYHTYLAYPGPLPDNEIISSNSSTVPNYNGLVTGSENAVLGLLGGWVCLNPPNGTAVTPDPNVGTDSVTVGGVKLNFGYTSGQVGGGPAFLNLPMLGQKGRPIGDLQNLGVPLANNSSYNGWTAYPGTALSGTGDTVIPEFMDTFSDPMPIIYIRARVGASGLATPVGIYPAQYDLGQAYPYLRSAPAANVNNGAFPDSASYPTPDSYVASPTTANDPVHKDQFILIAAGPPNSKGIRVYGTPNDVRN